MSSRHQEGLPGRVLRRIRYEMFVRGPAQLRAMLTGSPINAYWYREVKNFGDLLTPALLRRAGLTPIHAYPARAELVSVGSILEHLPSRYGGAVLGSGLLYPTSSVLLDRARVYSLRGHLTLERVQGLNRKPALGDPGLIANRLIKDPPQKLYEVGLVPHHADPVPPYMRDAISDAVAMGAAKVIDVMRAPERVVHEIASCKAILSTSLHGLIVADSFSIPSAWVAGSGLLGGDFKFRDYYSVFDGRVCNPVSLSGKESVANLQALCVAPDPGEIDRVRSGVLEAFELFISEKSMK